jgi:glycine cleavage system H protein
VNFGNLKFSATHEWVKADGDLATVGITDHAQSEMGDIVYLELPEAGTAVQKGDVFGAVESVKTVSDLLAPVSGEIVEVNEELMEAPEAINESPYASGWMIIIKMDDPSEINDLMTEEQYETSLQEH